MTMLGLRTGAKATAFADVDCLCVKPPQACKRCAKQCKGAAEEGYHKCLWDSTHPEFFPEQKVCETMNKDADKNPDVKKAMEKIRKDCSKTAGKPNKSDRVLKDLEIETDMYIIPMADRCDSPMGKQTDPAELPREACSALKTWKASLGNRKLTDWKQPEPKESANQAKPGELFLQDHTDWNGVKGTFKFISLYDQLIFKVYLTQYAMCLPKRCGCDFGKKTVADMTNPDNMNQNLPGRTKWGTTHALCYSKKGGAHCKMRADNADCNAIVGKMNEYGMAKDAPGPYVGAGDFRVEWAIKDGKYDAEKICAYTDMCRGDKFNPVDASEETSSTEASLPTDKKRLRKQARNKKQLSPRVSKLKDRQKAAYDSHIERIRKARIAQTKLL